jgi:hypothetical protein
MSTITESPRLKALKSAPLNSWIALSNDETSVVATGNSYEELSEKMEKANLTDSVVLKTPKLWTSFSV